MKFPALGLAIVSLAYVSAGAQTNTANPLDASRAFQYEQAQPHTNANGSESRFMFSGVLATGEAVSVHESVQPAGTAPPPLM